MRLATVWGIPTVRSAIIRHILLPISHLTVDHPSQGVADRSCHQERDKRILSGVPVHKASSLTNISLSLRVVFSCLPHVALASAVHISCCLSGTSRDIVERLPDLIENTLGCALLRLALLVTHR